MDQSLKRLSRLRTSKLHAEMRIVCSREPDLRAMLELVMAWRIETHLVRGEIDNRIRGKIFGQLWFLGRTEPVKLELQGNARRDMAGRLLTFINPKPEAGLNPSFASRQTGVPGEFTASRKCRIPDIPIDQVGEYYAAKKPIPWHWGNTVYFEWYSASNGRVVIESADYQLTVSADVTWEMTPAEEQAEISASGEAMTRFFEQLGFLSPDTSPASEYTEETPFESDLEQPTDSDDDGESWKREAPLSEEEADELTANSDLLSERLLSRLDEAEDAADLEAILEEELERRRKQRDEKTLTPEEQVEDENLEEDLQAAAEEIVHDPNFQEQMARRHPLSEQAKALAIRLMEFGDSGRWAPPDAGAEHPAVDMIHCVVKAGGKMAGALDAKEWPPSVDECALCISWLKRANGYLEDALSAGDFCSEQKLVPLDELSPTLIEIQRIHGQNAQLIEELRERLSRGFD